MTEQKRTRQVKPKAVKLVKMQRDDGKKADVHPDEVENFKCGNYKCSNEIK